MTAPIDAVSGLVERLRGKYRVAITDGLGPAGGEEPDNPNEFVRTFQTPPIQHEAADALEAQARELAEVRSDETFCADAVIDTSADSIAGLVTSNDEARSVEIAVQRALVFMRSLCNLRLAAAQSRIAALEDAVRVKDEALRPFSDCIFNDNGDITVSFRPFTSDELIAAYFARRTALAKGQNALVSGREDGGSLLRTIETLPDDFTDDGNCCAGKLKDTRP